MARSQGKSAEGTKLPIAGRIGEVPHNHLGGLTFRNSDHLPIRCSLPTTCWRIVVGWSKKSWSERTTRQIAETADKNQDGHVLGIGGSNPSANVAEQVKAR